MSKKRQHLRFDENLETNLKLIASELNITYNTLIENVLHAYINKIKNKIKE